MPLRALLRDDLKGARKANDREKVTLRTLIAAIDNAEAIDLQDSAAANGPGEASRRRLSDQAIMHIVLREGVEPRAAAEDYERHGQSDEANRLRPLSIIADRYADEMA